MFTKILAISALALSLNANAADLKGVSLGTSLDSVRSMFPTIQQDPKLPNIYQSVTTFDGSDAKLSVEIKNNIVARVIVINSNHFGRPESIITDVVNKFGGGFACVGTSCKKIVDGQTVEISTYEIGSPDLALRYGKPDLYTFMTFFSISPAPSDL